MVVTKKLVDGVGLYAYAAIGGAAIDYVVFNIVYSMGVDIYGSNFFAFLISVYVNYIVCKKIVFKNRSTDGFRLIVNYVLTAFTVLIGSFYIDLLKDIIGLQVAKISWYPFSYMLNFLIRKYHTFRNI